MEAKSQAPVQKTKGSGRFKAAVIVLLIATIMLMVLSCALGLASLVNRPESAVKVGEEARSSYRLNPSVPKDLKGVSGNVATLLDNVGEPLASETVLSSLDSLHSKMGSLDGGAAVLSKLDTVVDKLDALDVAGPSTDPDFLYISDHVDASEGGRRVDMVSTPGGTNVEEKVVWDIPKIYDTMNYYFVVRGSAAGDCTGINFGLTKSTFDPDTSFYSQDDVFIFEIPNTGVGSETHLIEKDVELQTYTNTDVECLKGYF